MYSHEYLLDEGYKMGLDIREKKLRSNSGALCKNRKIALNSRILKTTVQKRCCLSEEIWHVKTTVGNITDIRDINNLKQERFARKCSFKDLVPLEKIVKALLNYCLNLQDLCSYLEVTEEYFCEALTYYKQQYGAYYRCKEYTLYFEPLYVAGTYIDYKNELEEIICS